MRGLANLWSKSNKTNLNTRGRARRRQHGRHAGAISQCVESLERRQLLSVAPVAHPGGPYVADEGSAFLIDGTGSTDSDGTINLYQWDLHYDGVTFHTEVVAPSFYLYASDDAGAHTIALRVRDNSNDTNIATTTFTIHNVDPEITASGASTAVEGSVYTLNFAAGEDPGTDTISGWTVAWGDGATDFYAANATSGTHAYDDNGSFTAIATATDEDGDYTASQGLTVTNAAPVLSNVAVTSTVNEGGSVTLTGDISDPGTADSFSLTVQWGNGGSDVYSLPAGTTTFSQTHTYTDDAPTNTASDVNSITLSLSDDDGGNDTDSTSTTVSNVAPTLSNVNITASLNEGGTATLTGDIADPGTGDTFSLLVNWGDGSSDTYSLPAATTTFSKTHVYADDNPTNTASDNYTANLTLTDDDTGSDTDSASTTVNNVAPTVNLTGNNSVGEGTTYTLGLSRTDPGADTFGVYAVDWGDGTTENIAANATSATHTYTDGGNNYTISVTTTDDDTGASPAATKSITVTNVSPTLTLSGSSTSNEGSSYTLNFSASDPGSDTITGFTVDWGDGQTSNLAANATSSNHTFADDGSITITLSATDEDGTFTNTKAITVNNVAPTLNLSGNNAVNEGTMYTLNFAPTDPGNDTISGFLVDWGDGQTSNPASNATSATHTFTDNAVRTITLSATDEDGTFSDTKSVTVSNVAPTPTIGGSGSVNEGSSYTINLDATDPGSADTVTWSIDWGDGTTSSAGGLSTTANHQYSDDDALFTITATATDDDAGSNNDTDTVTVANVAPTAGLSGNNSVNEGSVYSLNLTATDPGSADTISWTIDWGDGSNDVASGRTPTVTHTYTDGDDDFTITVQATDDDAGASNSPTKAVHVANVAPSVTVTGNNSVNEGSTYTVNFSASDAGDDSITGWVIDWGDGNSDNYASNITSGTHTFADGGNSYTITATVTDEDGSANNTKSVLVLDVAPTIALSGNATVNEGSAYTLTLGAVTEPGDDTITSFIVNWGDGSNDTYGAAGAKVHTYADGSLSAGITVDIVDEDGTHTSAGTKSVTVNDVAPTIALAGNANVNEGSSYTLTLGAITEPGSDTVTSYFVNWGDGSTNTYGSAGAKTHTFADGSFAASISVNLVDEDGTHAAAGTKSVTVDDVAPTIALTGNNSVSEASSYTLTLGAVTDPGDDTITSYVVNWGDGNSNTYSTIGAKTHTFADGVTAATIDVDIVNEDGTFLAASSKNVTVNNVAPIVTVTGNNSVNEGVTYTVNFSASDPGDDTITGWVIDWGDGNSDNYAANATSGTHTYDDGGNSYTITATVTDEDGSANNTKSVLILDVAPTIALSGNASSNEGSSYSLTLGAVTEPGDDTITDYVVNWGDGSSDTYGTPGAKTHTFADGALSASITVDLVDEDGTHTSAGIKSVTVSDVAPTIALAGNANVNEASSYTLTLGAVTEPGTDTITSYIVNWGDGSTNTYGSAGAKTHTFADGALSANITVSLVDEDGTHASAGTKSVTVDDVAPTIALTGNAAVNEGSSYTLTLGAVTDPGDDTITSYIVHWGDGASNTYSTTGAKTHTFADDVAATIDVDIVNEDGTFLAAGTKSITVNNVAPTVTLTGGSSVNEGSTYTLNFSASDPGSDTITGWVIDWGDGSSDNYAANVTSGTHTYADGDNSYTITGTVTDEDGSANNTKSILVSNVAPTLTATGANSVNEGSAYTLNFSASGDPGTDTISGFSINWGDGQTSNLAANATSANHTFADNGSFTITLTATDEDGSFTTTKSVTVLNVAPTISATGNNSVNEGSAYTLNFGASGDTGADTISAWLISWGDGQTSNLAGNAVTANHTFADGSNNYTITATATDEDGSYNNTKSVTVDNVAPTISATGNNSVNEGTSYTLTIGAAGDPGTDTVSGWVIDWGDGQTSSLAANATSANHTFPDDGAFTITATATDEDGTYNSTKNVTVNNVAPTLGSVNITSAVSEGGTATLTGTITDPGSADTFTLNIDWGDGNSSAPTFVAGSTSFSVTHTFVDDDPTATSSDSYTVGLTLTDDNAGSDTDSTSLTVNNVAPTINVTPAATVNEGSVYTLNFTASDPGSADTLTGWTVDWGDGQTSNLAANATSATHTFADGGNSYSLSLSTADDDGGTDSNNFSVTVNNVAPTITATPVAPANEGSVFTLNFGASGDPGTDTISGFAVNWGDGSTGNFAANATSGTHTYADNGSFNIVVTATDEDGSYTQSAIAAISNVAPVASPSGAANINEGSSYSLTLSATDVGTADVITWLINWGDGSTSTASGLSTSSTHTYADNGNFTINATASDDDNGSNAGTVAVAVANVAPTAGVSGSDVGTEGSTYTLTLTTTDPGSADTFDWMIDWGDGTTTNTNGASLTPTHTFLDDGSYFILTTVIDDDGDSDARAFAVSVQNVAPTISASNTSSVNEGSVFTLDFGVTDPGTDTVSAWVVTWGDGATSNLPGDVASATHTFADGGNSYTITLTATDEDGTYNVTRNVTVANVAPTISCSGNASVNEGSVYTLNFGATDPGTDIISGFSINWGDGTTDSAPGDGSVAGHTYADNGSFNIVVTATDEDGSTSAAPFVLTVNNVAPTVSATGVDSVNEGSSYTINFSASGDPGTDTVSGFVINWGDGSTSSVASNVTSANHTFADGANSFTITVAATDEDGSYNATKSISVVNVAPTISFTGPSSQAEGQPATFNISHTDPGADTISGYVINWGDGSSSNVNGSASSASHVFANNGVFSIALAATDEDGTYNASASITINNAAPVPVISTTSTVFEGTTFTLNLDANDSGINDSISWVVNWGDGLTSATTGAFTSLTHSYPDDGSFTIAATATDNSSATGNTTLAVTVQNVAPTLNINGSGTVNEAGTYSVTISAGGDPGTDTITGFTLNWGDGQTSTLSAGTASASHVYADGAATRTLTLTATDEDGSYTGTSSVSVLNIAPTITLGGASTVAEGSVFTLSFSTTDPGTDTISGYSVNWGDGQTSTFGGSATSGTHTFADDGSFTITVSATDEDGTFTQTRPVTVTNVAPTASTTGASTSVEGSVYTLNLSATDPGSADAISWTINWGDGSFGSASGLTTSASHTFADDGNFTISATANDGDGGSASATRTVAVSNVTPTVNVTGAASVEEGSTYTFSFNTSGDPGADTISGYSINWGDGQTSQFGGSIHSGTHVFADNGAFIITVSALDEDGSASATQNVSVTNVTPTIILNAPASVDEGGTLTLNFSAADPGVDTISSFTVTWGDGSFDTFSGSTTSATHIYADGDAGFTINVAATDEDGSASATTSVQVNDVDPVLTLGGGNTANEGSTYTLTFNASDVSGDPIDGFIVDFGDGTSLSLDPSATSVTHVFADDGQFTITLSAVGEDGTFTATQAVTVLNVAPTATATGASTGAEGSVYTLNLSATDPGTTDVISWLIDWGDGSTSTAAGASTSAQHTFADNGSFNIIAIATDDDGDASPASVDVVIANVNPTGKVTGDTKGVTGLSRHFNGTFADVGLTDTHEVSWNFGDGSTINFHPTTDAGALSPSHVFTSTGKFVVTMIVHDDDGGTLTKTRKIAISTAQLFTDPANSDKTALYVGGTNTGDKFELKPTRNGGVQVLLGGNQQGVFNPTGRIIVFGQQGNDSVKINSDITRQTLVFGGAGKDNLTGGGGSDVLLGGPGNDVLTGNAGRDILIGGQGIDRLLGGKGTDILVAGSSSNENDLIGLLNTQQIWDQNTPVNGRVSDLGSIFSNETLNTDGQSDAVTGGDDKDWLLFSRDLDTLPDNGVGDVLTRV